MRRLLVVALLFYPCVCVAQTKPDSLDDLASQFWSWRAKYRPFTGDDIPRIERPGGMRDWSGAVITKQRADLSAFERRWNALDTAAWPVARKVDFQLIDSAIARVRWELDLNPRWQRDPTFYIEQTVGALQDALLPPPPFDEARAAELVVRAENIPAILEQAKTNLKPVAPFAKLAIAALSDIEARMQRVQRGVSPLLHDDAQRAQFGSAIGRASKAIAAFRDDLKHGLPNMQQEFALGREAYSFFLHRVALLPYSPEQLLTMARQDFERVMTDEALERQRNLGVPELTLPASPEDEIKRMERADAAIRGYLVAHGILSVPSDVPHWTMRVAPDYLIALDGFGELDDFTGPSRPKEDGIRWLIPANPGYFHRAYALDPRTTGVHEGVPGHFFQLCLSRRNPDAIRRWYYDSGANEGLGFYAEEMMLQAGLYDDSPHTREIIYSFARLRALRVEVDVKLALGQFTMEQAADYLARTVPMDRATAESEAADFATAPGLAIAYEIGKLQIEAMLAERRLQLGDKFNLREFHDYVWGNGNVPFSLQRWELLGLDDEIRKVNELAK